MTLVYLLLFLTGNILKMCVCINRNNPTEIKQLMAQKTGNGQRSKVWVKVRGDGVQPTNAGTGS